MQVRFGLPPGAGDADDGAALVDGGGGGDGRRVFESSLLLKSNDPRRPTLKVRFCLANACPAFCDIYLDETSSLAPTHVL